MKNKSSRELKYLSKNTYYPEVAYLLIKMVFITIAFTFSILLAVFYYVDDSKAILNVSVPLAISIIGYFLNKKLGKKYYRYSLYFAMFMYGINIIFAYSQYPEIFPYPAWFTVLFLGTLLVPDLFLIIMLLLIHTGLVFYVAVAYYVEESILYFVLNSTPAYVGMILVQYFRKRFNNTIYLLEESNLRLESRVEHRTADLEIEKSKLQYQADYDSLTNLPNRSLLHRELSNRIKCDKILTIMIIDIDRFKNINDIHGHIAGDKVLKIIASRIDNVKNNNDFLARMSGDEFVLISTLETVINQKNLALNIIREINEPIHIKEGIIYPTVSIGIYQTNKKRDTLQTVMQYADIAMYEAKKEGRGYFRFYKEEMMVKIQNRVKIEVELKHSLNNNDFILYYQPQIDLIDNKINSVEALVRWNHPEQGLLYPTDFIEVAEEINFIVLLDYYVLKEGMKQIVQWLEKGYTVPRISFNISGKHIQKDLFNYIKKLLKITKCDPKYIELEITEGYLLSNTEDVSIILKQLQSLGINIAIDDFGKGYSSLNYLKQLPIDRIKIDKSFIDNIGINTVDSVIVESIILIARSLKISVVAEGVETERQHKYLEEKGCRYIQGHYYYKAVDVATFEKNILSKCLV